MQTMCANIFLIRENSQDTEDQLRRESNILADNVAKNFLSRDISQDTEDQFMRESNNLADIVANNLLNRVVLKII